MTKDDYIHQILEVIEEYKIYSEQLYNLMKEDKVTYGSYIVHSLTYNHTYNWLYGMKEGFGKCKLYGNAKKKTKKIMFKIQLESIKKALEELKQELA